MSISTVLFLLFAGLASLASADFDRASATPDESPWLDNLAGKPVAAHHTQQEDDYALASRLAGGFHESDYEPPFDDGEPSTITLNNSAFLSNFTARGGVRQIDFVAKHGRIYANGQLFDLKGVNWFGSESRVGPPGGLNHHTIGWYVDFLARHHFNAIRLLFNHESILADAVVEPSELLRAPELRGKTYLTMFQLLARAAAKRGILVMMACHRLHPAAWPGHGLWYDPEGPITEEVVLRSWDKIATALCDEWNVFAVDLQNEPHAASWGFGSKTDWDLGASRIGQHVNAQCSRWLIMVEGVGYTPGAPGGDDATEGFWWGGNLVGAKVAPISLDPPSVGVTKNRLVYSPHTYGPGVYAQPYFSDASFPSNLEAVYEHQWAFVAVETGAPIVIGELGGFYTGKDKQWQDWALAYCKRKRIGVFYFGLNPTSEDTGGLLQMDWTSPEGAKLKALQPPAPPGTGTGMLGGSAVVVGGGLLVIVLGAAGLVRRWHALAVGVKPGEGEGDELLVTEGEGRSGSLHKEVAEAVEVERAWRVHRPAGGRNRETVEDMAAEWD